MSVNSSENKTSTKRKMPHSDPEIMRALKLARLEKQLGLHILSGRTRLATALGDIAYQEAIAREAAKRAMKAKKNFQVEYNYTLWNPKHQKSYNKRLVVTERVRSDRVGHEGRPGSIEYFFTHHKEHYMAEEQNRIEVTSIDIFDELNLQAIEPMYQPMNNFVLTPTWLDHASDIANTSLSETPDGCVPTSITKLLLSPPRGRPTTWIGPHEVSVNTIKMLLDELKLHDPPESRELDGYSSNVLSKLLRKAGRNHFAFDSDSHKFIVCKEFAGKPSMKDRMPVAWYCKHGHFYLVTGKEAIDSIAASSRSIAAVSKARPKKDEPDPRSVQVMTDNVDLIECILSGSVLEWSSGIYLVPLSNLTDVYLTWVNWSRNEGVKPIKINSNRDICEFSIETPKGKLSFVCEPDYGNIQIRSLQNAAEAAQLSFYGQSLTSMNRQILNHFYSKESLSAQQKRQIIEKQEGLCAICSDTLEEGHYEFDHIHPHANGGPSNSANFQCLCSGPGSCHREKTNMELASGYSFQSSYESTLHPLMHDEFRQLRAKMWARVEHINITLDGPTTTTTEQEDTQGPFRVPTETEPCMEDEEWRQLIEEWRQQEWTQQPSEETPPVPEEQPAECLAEVDLIKCRRNLLMGYHRSFFGRTYEWPVYCVMDFPCPFQGKLQTGCYYVHTDCNRGPFRGNGWHYLPDIEYGLIKGYISRNDIKLEYIPSKTLPHDHFCPLVKCLLDFYQHDEDLQKHAINYLVGSMARMTHSVSYPKFSLDQYEAGRWAAQTDHDFTKTLDLQDDTPLYFGSFVHEVVDDTTCSPLYNMIIGMEACEVDQLSDLVSEFVGLEQLRAYATDAVRHATNGQTEGLLDHLSKQFWDEEGLVPKYRYVEKAKPLKHEAMANLKRDHVHPENAFTIQFAPVAEVNPRQESVAHLLGQSLLIHGPAGYGKTELVKALMTECDRQDLTYVQAAPTNQAAENLSGVTIHSLHRASGKAVDVVFVDEPSMNGEEAWRFLLQLKRKWPDAHFVLCGDFAQLKPVRCWWDSSKNGEGDFENCAPLWYLCGGRRMDLTTFRRGDASMGEICQQLRRGVYTGEEIDPALFPVRVETDINIAVTHKTRKRVIADRMAAFVKNRRSVHVPANPKDNRSQPVDLSEGMPLIAHRRWDKAGVKNACRATIVSVKLNHHGKDEMVITLDRTGKIVEMKTSDFHKYWRPAFCITVYNSQCLTFREPYTIHDWDHFAMKGRSAYVAITRGTCMTDPQIAPPPVSLREPINTKRLAEVIKYIENHLHILQPKGQNRAHDKVREVYSWLCSLRDSPPERVEYRYATGIGRLYVSGGSKSVRSKTMQDCYKGLRAPLIGHVGHDIDIENSLPSLTIQWLDMFGERSAELPLDSLRDFVNHREKWFEGIGEWHGCDRDTAKHLVLVTLFGGDPSWKLEVEQKSDVLYPKLQQLVTDLAVVRHNVVTWQNEIPKYKELYNQKLKQKRGDVAATERSMFSLYTHEVEDVVMGHLRDFMALQKIEIFALIFDGMITSACSDAILRAAEAYVEDQTGLHIKLAEKPLFGLQNQPIPELACLM